VRITRLYLRNYRVYEGEHDLAMPAGLVGIYGPNGSGKSAILGSIRWTLYGKDRTPNDQIRTSGVNADCVTEVEFEHEGHLYLVRRTISGINSTVKAEAHWNNQQVAEGVRDVATYVHSVLGMDDQSFRSSVFAEQKQVAAFSMHGPAKRRELVLRMLGITPLDKARDAARSDARDARNDHERLSARLPDLGELEELVAAAEQHAATVAEQVTVAEGALATAAEVADAAEARFEQVDDVARTYDALVIEGKGAKAIVEEATERLAALTTEQAALADVESSLAELRPQAEGIEALESRLRALEAVAAASAALDALPTSDPPEQPDEAPVEAARTAAEQAAAAAAELAGAVKAAEQELARAEAAAARTAELSGDEDCPVCGQELGGAFEQVVEHRTEEVRATSERLAAERARLADAESVAKLAAREAREATAAFTAASKAWSAWEQQAARRFDAEAALARAQATCVELAVSGTVASTQQELVARKRAATEVAKLEARLERAPVVARELDIQRARLAEATATREALLEKVRSLDHKPADLEAAKAARQEARQALKAATDAATAARSAAATATAAVQTTTARLTDAKQQHADLHDLAERSRHLGRLGDLLNDFRNNVVAVVGPRLAAQAAELFAELTDNEYDRLEVDADTYDIQITDGGRTYGMDRFSGSEVDLANLALRVAISEHVRFQSGGAVGLLVLDEVFGPLDDERKERMLLALERLKGRFRQVLVVTHDSAIKEQLPNAIQVEKLPGRRARATVLGGV
jgi:exonuclease SbcC